MDGGNTYSFSVAVPETYQLSYFVKVYVQSAAISVTTFEVFGYPTTASTLACAAANTRAGFTHILETITCRIAVRDDSGPTLGLASDFAFTVSEGIITAALSTVDGGASFQFQLQSPNASVPVLNISAALSNGGAITQSPVSLSLICT